MDFVKISLIQMTSNYKPTNSLDFVTIIQFQKDLKLQ
jgi:hypothetical protein